MKRQRRQIFISIDRELVEELLENARALYPREVIFVLRGDVEKSREALEVHATDYLLPPSAYRGPSSAGYNPFMLPLDSRIVGTAHSHPSGVLRPSIQDLNSLTGIFSLIMAFPYKIPSSLAAFNRKGEALPLHIA
jgi:proteasome lid subunit RPN8/RPN11